MCRKLCTSSKIEPVESRWVIGFKIQLVFNDGTYRKMYTLQCRWMWLLLYLRLLINIIILLHAHIVRVLVSNRYSIIVFHNNMILSFVVFALAGWDSSLGLSWCSHKPVVLYAYVLYHIRVWSTLRVFSGSLLLFFCDGPACRLHDSLSRNLCGDHSLIKGNLTAAAGIYFLVSHVFPYKKICVCMTKSVYSCVFMYI